MKISAKTKFCIIIGDPVDHSLSPAMHNAAYKHLGIDGKFVYLGSNVKITDVKKIVKAMRAMNNFRGLTCTIPHKIEVMKYLDWVDSVAEKIGAVNTVVNDNGRLKGYNTDWLGVVKPLEKITGLKGKKIAVLGAGGAARAVVYGVLIKGAKVKIFNRTEEKAKKLAEEFGCQGTGLDREKEIAEFDIIINASPVGMMPNEDQTPIATTLINKNQIIFDIVYKPFKTKLLREAEKKGAVVIPGVEMLLHQGTAQFELYTNCQAPVDIMKRTLYRKLKIKN